MIEYKVDWGKKWKEGRYTWEPVTNLNHCPDKIEAFLRGGAAAGNKGRGKNARVRWLRTKRARGKIKT